MLFRSQIEFSQTVQAAMDARGGEFSATDLWRLFEHSYHLAEAPQIEHQIIAEQADGQVLIEARVAGDGQALTVRGQGSGPLDAFVDGIMRATGASVRVLDFHEHAIGAGAQARAAAYLELRIGDRRTLFGIGISASIVTASMQAVLSGLRRAGVALRQAEPATV